MKYFSNFLKIFLLLARDAGMLTAGQRFMTNLLVSSLMADGGLEIALQAAIKKEAQEIEKKVSDLYRSVYLLNVSPFIYQNKMFPHLEISIFGFNLNPV